VRQKSSRVFFAFGVALVSLLMALAAVAADAFDEQRAPFRLADRWTQSKLVDYTTLKARDPDYPDTFRSWDMICFGGPDNRLVFIPHEVSKGAGLTRYDRETGRATVLLAGDNSGVFDADPKDGWDAMADDFGSLDPAVMTPAGTLLTGEEGYGRGRLFELLNPLTATGRADARWRWLSNIPSVAHEGIKFDRAGAMYFVDEDQSGSLYRFVPLTPGDYSRGQTFVLVAADFAGDPAKDWHHAVRSGQGRTGAARWVALTDSVGRALTRADPFDFRSRGGRAAADEVNGTPFGRPEDLEIGALANGNQVLYVATTSENRVWSIELLGKHDVVIRVFVSSAQTPDASGRPVGEGRDDRDYGLDDPDNLAIGADGRLYIVEDEDPGDIWQALDADRDGVAESVSLIATLGPFGAEPTGLIQDPEDADAFVVAVQHPRSGNDALWYLRRAPPRPMTGKEGE